MESKRSIEFRYWISHLKGESFKLHNGGVTHKGEMRVIARAITRQNFTRIEIVM